MSRPGTVPSKPVLGVNLPSKHKPRPKTSDSKSDKSSPQDPEDPDKISEDKIAAELHQITNKHDKKLLKRLSTMKDLDALVSTNPLQLVKKSSGEAEVEDSNVRFNDNRSLWSERRSVLTSFTGQFSSLLDNLTAPLSPFERLIASDFYLILAYFATLFSRTVPIKMIQKDDLITQVRPR